MTNGATTPGTEVKPLSPELIFQQRKRRLLAMLGNGNGEASPLYKPSLTSPSDANAATVEGPPFTIQRIAEVLLAPERVSGYIPMFVVAVWWSCCTNFLPIITLQI